MKNVSYHSVLGKNNGVSVDNISACWSMHRGRLKMSDLGLIDRGGLQMLALPSDLALSLLHGGQR